MTKVAVRDRGPGLRGDKLDKIFQPFYTTKRDGLGMSRSTAGVFGRRTIPTGADVLLHATYQG